MERPSRSGATTAEHVYERLSRHVGNTLVGVTSILAQRGKVLAILGDNILRVAHLGRSLNRLIPGVSQTVPRGRIRR